MVFCHEQYWKQQRSHLMISASVVVLLIAAVWLIPRSHRLPGNQSSYGVDMNEKTGVSVHTSVNGETWNEVEIIEQHDDWILFYNTDHFTKVEIHGPYIVRKVY